MEEHRTATGGSTRLGSMSSSCVPVSDALLQLDGAAVLPSRDGATLLRGDDAADGPLDDNVTAKPAVTSDSRGVLT